MSAHELKGLQVRKTKLDVEVKTTQEELRILNEALQKTRDELNVVQRQIDNLTAKSPVVTEHALLRYIERVFKVNLAEIQAAILTEHNLKAIAFAGSCRIKSQGVELIVKDRCVVSVV